MEKSRELYTRHEVTGTDVEFDPGGEGGAS